MSFKDKVVIVTGGSSGIGRAIALKFAEEGAKVAIVGRNQERLKEVSAKCKDSLTITADVTKDEDCVRIIKETIAHYGKLDILVNNAGIFEVINIKDERAIDVFDDMMVTNLRSAVRLTNLAAEHLIKTKGNIVNISSVDSLGAIEVGNLAYGVSNAGKDHLTRCSALDLSVHGVRVNCVNPGPVVTPIIDDPAQWEAYRQVTSLKRVSEPGEIADVVLFLASDKAVAITGSIFLADNGYLLVN